MNQTQKRLSIIKMAISMTDMETIQQQISKLRLLKEDSQIQKIIEALDSESYAQAQNLIQEYIDSPIQEVHQRVPDSHKENKESTYTKREQELIDEFDLFVSNANEEKNTLLDIEQYMSSSSQSSSKEQEVNFDKLLEIEPKDIELNTAEKNDKKRDELSYDETTDIESSSIKTEENPDEKNEIFFDKQTTTEEERPVGQPVETQKSSEPIEEEIKEEEELISTLGQDTKEQTLKELSDPVIGLTKYRPIFSIKQQFLDASRKYPFAEQSTKPHSTVNTWMNQISNQRGYTKKEVEEVVRRAMKLSQSNINHHKSEAAELILLSGLTEDEFGQLILAREFYKGTLFQRNIPEAFKRIEQLANKEFPEAICDLAQFYEHGVGTKSNKKKAKELYEKAMHLGIKRAQKHFERIKKKSGFFSF